MSKRGLAIIGVGEVPTRRDPERTRWDILLDVCMEAIRDAARKLGTRSLEGCIIYATSRPCRMCETAAYWANVSHIYYGDALNDGGRPDYSSC